MRASTAYATRPSSRQGTARASGFSHHGKQLAFVYDVADLYKHLLTVPVAFAAAAEDHGDALERVVRARCRDAFRQFRLLERIVADVRDLLDLSAHVPLPDGFDPDDDAANPTAWWTPPEGAIVALSGDGAFGDAADAVSGL